MDRGARTVRPARRGLALLGLLLGLGGLAAGLPVRAQQPGPPVPPPPLAPPPPAPVFRLTPKELELGTMKAVSGKEMRVERGAAAPGDVYASVVNAKIDGIVHGDVLALAVADFRLSGVVERDVSAISANVDIAGKVGSRLRVAAGTLDLAGEVGADAVLAAGTAHLHTGSVVHGSLALSAGKAELDGTVDGPAWIGNSGKVHVAGRFAGDVTIECDELTIAPGTRIEGNLTWFARTPVTVPEGVVLGEVRRAEAPPERPPEDDAGATGAGLAWHLVLHLYFAFAAVVGGVLMLLFFRPVVDGAVQRATRGGELATCFGIGLVGLLSLLVITLLCCLALPLALAMFSGLAALGYFGGLVGKIILGRLVLQRVGRDLHPIVHLVLGVALVFLVGLIPVVGGLFWLAVTVTGMGAALLQLREGRPAAA